MKERIKDKIKEIEQYLNEMANIKPANLEEYKTDNKTKAACERYFEKIIEAVTDLAFILIKEQRLRIPEDDKEAFDVLRENNLVPEKITKRLKEAKGMRNILAHEYGKVDDRIVYSSITEELENDVKGFIEAIKKSKIKNPKSI